MPVFTKIEGSKDDLRRAESRKWCLGCCAACKRWERTDNGEQVREDAWIEGWEIGSKPLKRKILRAGSEDGYFSEHFDVCAES